MVPISALLLVGCRAISGIPAGPWTGAAGRPSYLLKHQTEERQGIRLWYVTRYQLFERDTAGKERELWRKERREKYASHKISTDGTVWVATQGVPAPGGGGSVWMRRLADPQASATGIEYVVGPVPSTRGSATRVYSPYVPPPNLGLASVRRLGSGAEQLRFEIGGGRERRLTWLDRTGETQHREGPVPRWTIQELPRGARDPWTEALDRAKRVPMDADLAGNARDKYSPIRFWNSPNGPLALRGSNGWAWEWPVQLEPVETLRSEPLGYLGYGGGYLWFQADPGVAPQLRIVNKEGKDIKAIDLSRYGYANAETFRKGMDPEDARTFGAAAHEQSIADIDPTKVYVNLKAVAYPRQDRGRLVVILGGANAPRVELKGAAETIERLSRKEDLRPTTPPMEERSFWSPSRAFRARIRRWPNPYGEKEPIGYLTLLGRRTIEDREIEVEMYAGIFYGPMPIETRVYDDGSVATLENLGGKLTANLANPDGHNRSGWTLVPDWFPTEVQAKRDFHLSRTIYAPKGTPTHRTIGGVRVPEWPSATWTLPTAKGTRAVQIARQPDGTRRVWWQD